MKKFYVEILYYYLTKFQSSSVKEEEVYLFIVPMIGDRDCWFDQTLADGV